MARPTEIKAKDIMSTKFLQANKEDSISALIGNLIKNKQDEAVVFDKSNKYAGITQKSKLVKAKINPTKTKVDSITTKPPVIQEDTDLITISELLLGTDVTAIPVITKNKVVGLVTRTNILQTYNKLKELGSIKVQELMTREPICFHMEDRMGDAIHIMREQGFSRLPIVDKQGKLYGIIALEDLIFKAMIRPLKKQKGFSPKTLGITTEFNPSSLFTLNTNVGDLANRPPITITKRASIKNAIKLLIDNHISSIVVTEKDMPIGLLTKRDLIDAVLRLKEFKPEIIHIIGLKNLKPMQATKIKEMASGLYTKILKNFHKEIIYMSVHVKSYHEKGVKHKNKAGKEKYALHIKVAIPSCVYVARGVSWNLDEAMGIASDTIEKEIRRSAEKQTTRSRFPKTRFRIPRIRLRK